MKGEYVHDQDENQQSHPHNLHTMFPKFPPLHQHQHPKFHPTHFAPHSFALAPKDSEEVDSGASLQTTTSAADTATPTPSTSKKPKTVAAGGSEDGGTIEVARRPRGRPLGSKNKPNPSVVITREPEPAMAPYILEVPGGSDIVDSLTRFTLRRGIGLCVLTVSGAVTNVSLKQPSTAAPGGTVTFNGRFDILSLSAVLLNAAPFGGSSSNNNKNGGFTFTISLAGPQGQIVGGKVVGPLVSSGTVYVIAASFNSPSFTRLPIDDHDAQNQSTGAAGGGDGQSSSPVSGGGGSGGGGGGGGSGSGGLMGLYGCHLGSPSDVIWALTARPPPLHY